MYFVVEHNWMYNNILPWLDEMSTAHCNQPLGHPIDNWSVNLYILAKATRRFYCSFQQIIIIKKIIYSLNSIWDIVASTVDNIDSIQNFLKLYKIIGIFIVIVKKPSEISYPLEGPRCIEINQFISGSIILEVEVYSGLTFLGFWAQFTIPGHNSKLPDGWFCWCCKCSRPEKEPCRWDIWWFSTMYMSDSREMPAIRTGTCKWQSVM